MKRIMSILFLAGNEEEYNKLLNRFIESNECPRCKNTEIKSTDNFCKICGLSLKELNILKGENSE